MAIVKKRKIRKRKRTSGFLARSRKKVGRKIFQRKRRKGRWKLSI